MPSRHTPTTHADGARPSRAWLDGATLAAAATLGVLVGLGIWEGASLGRLGVVTNRLRGLPEFVAPDRRALGTALVGGAWAAVTGGAWGAALGQLVAAADARGLRGARALAAAGLGGLALAVVDPLLPTPLRLAAGALAPAERVLAALLVAGAAWAADWLGRRARADAADGWGQRERG